MYNCGGVLVGVCCLCCGCDDCCGCIGVVVILVVAVVVCCHDLLMCMNCWCVHNELMKWLWVWAVHGVDTLCVCGCDYCWCGCVVCGDGIDVVVVIVGWLW